MKRNRNIKQFFRSWLKLNRAILLIYTRAQRLVSFDKSRDQEVPVQRSVTNVIKVTHGADNIMVIVETIAYLQRVDRVTMAFSFTGEQYIIDKSIDSLSSELDKQQFFKIRRSCIVNRDLVQGYQQVSSYRLRLITPITDNVFFVSQRSTAAFKRWWGMR